MSVLRWLILTTLIGIFEFNLSSPNWQNQITSSSTRATIKYEEVAQYQPSIVTVIGYGQTKNQTNRNSLFNILNRPMSGNFMTIGTGFIISKDGEIMTNKHVVENVDANYRVSLANGQRYSVTSVYRDPNNDVAVLKIDPSQYQNTNLVPITLGDSTTVEMGEPVATIGVNPYQNQKEIKTGIVSGLNDQVIAENPYMNSSESLRDVIETSLDLIPGNSGSPLIDSQGEVVGINTATASSYSNLSFAIPINSAKIFLDSVNK